MKDFEKRLQALERASKASGSAVAEKPPTLLEGMDLFRYGVQEPGSLGVRIGDDGRRHIVVTDAGYGHSTNAFSLEYDATLNALAPAFDAEWYASGCPRLLLLDRGESSEALAAIDRGDLVWRDDGKVMLWWNGDAAAKRIAWTFLDRLDSTARLLRDQGEIVNSLADLRALLAEALAA